MISCNSRFNWSFGVFLIASFIFSSCTTEPKREIIKSEHAVKSESVLPVDVIDKRISVLEELLTNNKIQGKDRVTIADLIADYHRIKVLSQGGISQSDYGEIILMLFRNLSLLDEKYFLNQEQASDEIFLKAANDLSQKKRDIFIKYINNDYRAVISECGKLEKIFGKDAITFEIDILLAMSLAADGRLPEAVNTGDKIIKELEQRPDLIHLRAGMVQWRLDIGKKENAFKEYQKLIENMDQRQTILDRTTGRVNSKSKKASESDQVLNRLLDKEINPDINSRITGMLKEIVNLENQGDFTGARLLLLKWKLQTDKTAELVEINKALTDLELFERQYQERLTTDKKEGIEAATKLIEEEDYESAINILDRIKSDRDSSPEIDKQRAIAIEKLINQERNRAARIFLTAGKTNDIKKKKELLLSAQDILIGLLEKYPSSGMAEKVKSNLDSVINEFKKIQN